MVLVIALGFRPVTESRKSPKWKIEIVSWEIIAEDLPVVLTILHCMLWRSHHCIVIQFALCVPFFHQFEPLVAYFKQVVRQFFSIDQERMTIAVQYEADK